MSKDGAGGKKELESRELRKPAGARYNELITRSRAGINAPKLRHDGSYVRADRLTTRLHVCVCLLRVTLANSRGDRARESVL